MIAEDKVRTMMESLATDTEETVYTKEATKLWFQVFFVGAVIGMYALNYHLLNPETVLAHARTAVITFIAVRIWNFIPDYFDIAEEVGLVKIEKEPKEDTENNG